MKPKTIKLFVDEVDGRVARLLLGQEAFVVPRALLPRGAREGKWLKVSVTVVPGPPRGISALRRRLGRGDPGGDLKL